MAPSVDIPSRRTVNYRALFSGHLPDVGFFDSRGMTGKVSGGALADDVCAVAAGLAHYGVRRGDRVMLLVPTGREYITALLACLVSGIAPCTIAAPAKPADATSSGIRHLHAVAAAVHPAALIVADHSVTASVPHGAQILTVDTLTGHGKATAADLPTAKPDNVHHLQLTSGSTSTPKAVVLTHTNVAANLAALREVTDPRPVRDSLLTWLPLYHDMGLMQVLFALTEGIGLDLMPPAGFVRDPLSWLRHMSQRGTTITAAPPFAYRLAADRFLAKPDPDIDLRRARHLFIGAEPIPVSVLTGFRDTFSAVGLDPRALLPSYGMAETVVATTVAVDEQSPADTAFGRVRWQNFDRVALHEQQVARRATEGQLAVGIVSCGRPVSGLEIRIIDQDQQEVPAGVIGAVHVRGSSVMAGYLGTQGLEAPPEGWHDTGDLGLLEDGEIYIVGRTKEMLIIRGRNLPPYDVEAVIEQHPLVAAAVVFSYTADSKSTEPVVALVESTAPTEHWPQLRTDISMAVREAFGLSLADVVVVNRGRMPRTSSGKRQRAEVRAAYLADAPIQM